MNIVSVANKVLRAKGNLLNIRFLVILSKEIKILDVGYDDGTLAGMVLKETI
jgi:hypothetical protein